MAARRKCILCKQIKPLTPRFFHRASDKGFYRKCKICRNGERARWRQEGRHVRNRRTQEQQYSRARSRAFVKLAKMHPQDFEVLMARELDIEQAKEGSH